MQSRMPQDTLEIMFSFLSKKDLLQLIVVNSAFHNMKVFYQFLWLACYPAVELLPKPKLKVDSYCKLWKRKRYPSVAVYSPTVRPRPNWQCRNKLKPWIVFRSLADLTASNGLDISYYLIRLPANQLKKEVSSNFGCCRFFTQKPIESKSLEYYAQAEAEDEDEKEGSVRIINPDFNGVVSRIP